MNLTENKLRCSLCVFLNRERFFDNKDDLEFHIQAFHGFETTEIEGGKA